MIVDRFKEIKCHINEKFKPEVDKTDSLYPFFQLVRNTTRQMHCFTEMIDVYKSKIVHFFSIVDEEQRAKELNDMMRHRKNVKEKMHQIKKQLYKIEHTFLRGKKNKPESTKVISTKKKEKNQKINPSTTLPRIPSFREGEEMNNLYDIQYRFIINSFLSKCEYFFKIEQNFKERKEAEVIRRMKIFTEDVDEEELKGIIMKGADFHQVQELYKSRTFVLRKNDKRNIRIELDSLNETKKELLDLEMQMNEILEMFQDMFVLTNLLDEPINNVQYMVEKSNHYVVRATRHLQNAKKVHPTTIVTSPKCLIQ